MGKFYFSADYLLGLLCASALAFPSLASAGTVSVEVSPTTGYTSTTSSTFAPPSRSSTSTIQTYKPELGPLAGGGAYQTMRSGITITGIKQDSQTLTSTISSRLRATAGAMKNGVSRCFTSFRCNVALIAGSAGIEALIDGIGGIIDDAGRLNMPDNSPIGSVPPPSNYLYQNAAISSFSTNITECKSLNPENQLLVCYPMGTNWVGLMTYRVYECPRSYSGQRLTGTQEPPMNGAYGFCYYGGSAPAIEPTMKPASPDDIKAAVDSSYTPNPSDLPFLASGGLDFSGDGVDIEIIDIPSVSGADSPNYIEYSDGTSKGIYSEYEFTWGGPSKQPEISVSEKTTETTYDQTGAVSDITVSGGTSSGSSANNPPEVPTDCDFMPTVCRFIDWFTEPDPELSQDADFSQLIDDVEIERDFSVGSSTASCPAPFVVHLKWVPSVEISLQPFCDFVDLLRPVLLALAWLVSGMIVLRT